MIYKNVTNIHYRNILLYLNSRVFSKNCTKKINYKDSLNLPKTKFPLSMKDGIVLKRELKIQKDCRFDELYRWQHETRSSSKEFILHDGPPYANGEVHVGHALNKILKDITNRYKLLRGHRVTFKPGWDCHGLPIELKALTATSGDAEDDNLSAMQIREKAEKFARATVKKQKRSFRRWGIMADWSESGCYHTYDKTYEAKQLDTFYDMYAKKKLYRGVMPVYWSPSSRTALAEAELEYKEDHTSPSLYLKCKITSLPDDLQYVIGNRSCHTVIWTTTPWTLPSNEAICIHNNIGYSIVEDTNNQLYIIGDEFKQNFSEILNCDLKVIYSFTGASLLGATYQHPTRDCRQSSSHCCMLHSDHVTTDRGTGLVHTAPAHGPDDFKVALANDLPVNCIVDEKGLYTNEADEYLIGKHVLQQGNQLVLERLRDDILQCEDLQHSYPYDWRTKKPVILRASKQWFIDTAAIKEDALECLESSVTITPPTGSGGMLSQLRRRPYWCMSRQRVWGVPIPVFYSKQDGGHLISRCSIDHLMSLVGKHGSDCWWTLPMHQLLPDHVIQQSGFAGTHSDYTKGEDILDIWFDSGSSWASVLQENQQADVYLEGLDQFGGWFQSSLLVSVATRNLAPYKNIVVHGFTIDERGVKMSKSLGNVVDPNEVINGTKEKSGYGIDVLRWWASLSNLDPRVLIGDSILFKCNEQVFKIRKSLRFLLGNLSDFEFTRDTLQVEHLLVQDKYVLHCLNRLIGEVTEAYDSFNYTKAMLKIDKFINVTLSLHNHITKDRLYCDLEGSPARRSAQTVQWYMLRCLVLQLAPVLPHLCEEVNTYKTLNSESTSLFKVNTWTMANQYWDQRILCSDIDTVLEVRNTLHEMLSSDDPINRDVLILVSPLLLKRFKDLGEDCIQEILQCADLSIELLDQSTGQDIVTINDDTYYRVEIKTTEKLECARCRQFCINNEHKQSLCTRCLNVTANI